MSENNSSSKKETSNEDDILGDLEEEMKEYEKENKEGSSQSQNSEVVEDKSGKYQKSQGSDGSIDEVPFTSEDCRRRTIYVREENYPVWDEIRDLARFVVRTNGVNDIRKNELDDALMRLLKDQKQEIYQEIAKKALIERGMDPNEIEETEINMG